MRIEVYSDGSATTKDKPGGYGWVMVVDGAKHSEGSGHMESASNNDAELEAAIQGLRAVKSMLFALRPSEGPVVTLVSDSQIVLGWASGTYTFRQQDKMHKFKELQLLVNYLVAGTRWVEGHTGDVHNERCDELANMARLGDAYKAPRAKKKSSKRKVPMTVEVKMVREAIENMTYSAVEWAGHTGHKVGTSDWRVMFVDKLEELLNNSDYFSIERENTDETDY